MPYDAEQSKGDHRPEPTVRDRIDPAPDGTDSEKQLPRRPLPTYHDNPPTFGPVQLWRLSTRLYRAGHYRTAKVVKGICFLLFRAILPPEAEIGKGVRLEHYGFGVVIHPNTTVGDRSRIYHGVTLGSNAAIGSSDRIIIGADVLVGSGATIINHAGATLRIGDRSRIGANALVVRSVDDDTVVRAPLGVVAGPGSAA